jgi:formylglycine-generating enzyme
MRRRELVALVVCEWTTDWWSTRHHADAPKACCIPANPQGGPETRSSHLCAPNNCRRYRPAARHAQPVDTSTSHVGFRCILRKGANHE